MRPYLICIGFLHFLLLVVGLTIIVMSGYLMQDKKKEYLIYKMMYCKDLVIIFLCAGVINLFVFLVSGISSALTFPSTEFRALYRLVAFLTLAAIVLNLVFLFRSATCKESQDDVTLRFFKIFKNYGKYDLSWGVVDEPNGETPEPGGESSFPGGMYIALSNDTLFFDYIQFKYQCCGVWGAFDYAKIDVPVPVTCCGGAERSYEEILQKRLSDSQHERLGVASRNGNPAAPPGSGGAVVQPGGGKQAGNEEPDPPPQSSTATPSATPSPGTPTMPANAHQPLDCGGCINALYDAHKVRNIAMWILVLIKIVLDVYVATSSCFILIAESAPGKYPT